MKIYSLASRKSILGIGWFAVFLSTALCLDVVLPSTAPTTTNQLDQSVSTSTNTPPKAETETSSRPELLEQLPFPDLKRQAETGDAGAQYALGRCYNVGKGVPKDEAEAVKWYRKAAEQGDVEAQLWLGRCYTGGIGGLKGDPVEGMKWVLKAAECGYSAAQRDVGVRYMWGIGVSKNCTEAVVWYRKAAEQGDLDAACWLGDLLGGDEGSLEMYCPGGGVPQNLSEAVKWYRIVAEHGHSRGQRSLSYCYSEGRGVPQDFVEAYKWVNLAAAQVNEWKVIPKSDTEMRDRLARRMTPEQIAEGQRRASLFVARRQSPKAGTRGTELPATAAPKASGTGFFITKEGFLLTNHHVVEDASTITVVSNGRKLAARIIKSDPANDLALLQVNVKAGVPTGSYFPLPVVNSRKIRLGESVATIGFPNITVQGIEPKLTRGEINSLAGIQDDPRYFQMSVAVQPGNSGGPLVDAHGNVIGIITMRLNDVQTLKLTGSLPQNVNYALKSSFVLALLDTVPDLVEALPEANSDKARPFDDVVEDMKNATALVLVY